MAFSKYYNMVGARIEPPPSGTSRPEYSQSDTPDVTTMGTSDFWSGCAPCHSLPPWRDGKFILPKVRYLNRGLGWERIITNADLPKKPSVIKQISVALTAMDDLEP